MPYLENVGTVSKNKKKLMEFSIKLAGGVLDAPVFNLENDDSVKEAPAFCRSFLDCLPNKKCREVDLAAWREKIPQSGMRLAPCELHQ